MITPTPDLLTLWCATIDALYHEELHRAPDPGGMAAHLWAAMQGQQEPQLRAFIRASGEWRQLHTAPPSVATSPYSPVPTPAELCAVQCNFLNVRDSQDRIIFSSSLPALDEASQRDWIAREQAAGGTHYVVSVETGYPGYWVPIVNYWSASRMAEWIAAVDRILASGLHPVIFLHNGGPRPQESYFRGLCRWIRQSASHLIERALWVPAWEPVRNGDWTPNELNRMVQIMRDELGPTAIFGFHGTPGTHTFGAGHGTDPTDPWNGMSEPDEWRAHAGLQFDVLLFQTMPARDEPRDEWGQPLWWDRALDVAERFLAPGTPMPGAVGVKMRDRQGNETTRDGYAGGPKSAVWFGSKRAAPALVAFEYVAPLVMHDDAPPSLARAVADTLLSFGYKCFGNGLPTR